MPFRLRKIFTFGPSGQQVEWDSAVRILFPSSSAAMGRSWLRTVYLSMTQLLSYQLGGFLQPVPPTPKGFADCGCRVPGFSLLEQQLGLVQRAFPPSRLPTQQPVSPARKSCQCQQRVLGPLESQLGHLQCKSWAQLSVMETAQFNLQLQAEFGQTAIFPVPVNGGRKDVATERALQCLHRMAIIVTAETCEGYSQHHSKRNASWPHYVWNPSE